MKTRKTILLVIAVIILSTAYASAQDITRQRIAGALMTVRPIMSTLCKALKHIGGALASLIFLWAAIRWIMSRDEPAKRKQAKDMMVAVIIGILIVGLAISIVKGVAVSLELLPSGASFIDTFC